MSFDIFFMTGRFAKTSVTTVDPATGKARKTLPSDPLTSDELAAVQTLLQQVGAYPPVRDGYYRVDLVDGGGLEIYGKNLEEGLMVCLRGSLTAGVLQFLMDLLAAGNWLMIPAMEDTVAITASSARLTNTPDSFPNRVVCESADEVGILLSKGVRRWQKYRDKVVGNHPETPAS